MTSLPGDNNPVNKCYYLASKGSTGLPGLKAIIQYGKRTNANWLSSIQLHGACMNNHVDTTLPYLINELGKDIIDNIDEEGNTSLHVAIIWGRNSVVVYLLSCGASINVKNKQMQTCLELAQDRLFKLVASERDNVKLKGKDLTKADFEKIKVEAKELVDILTNITAATSYNEFAKKYSYHHLVKQHSYWAYRGQQRLQLVSLLRHLVLQKRAMFKTKEELELVNLANGIKSLNMNKNDNNDSSMEKETPDKPKNKTIAEILHEYGLDDDKCFARSLKLLEVYELNDLRPIDKNMIVQLDLTSKERRRLWNMIKEEKEKLPELEKKDDNKKKKVNKRLSRKEKKLIEEKKRKENQKKLLKEKQQEDYINSLKLLSEPDLPLLAVNVILRFIY